MTLISRLASLLFAAGTLPALVAEPPMVVTIPHAAKVPALDGKIDAGEWDDAAAVTGIINQLDKEAHPRQATFWLKYDDKNLYIAQRSTLLPGEKKAPPVTLPGYVTPAVHDVAGVPNFIRANTFNRANVAEAMPPLYFKDNQNTVVIALSPNRVNSGDTPSYYRFMANINSTVPNRRELCDQIKGIKFVSLSSVLDSLDVRGLPNSAKAFNSFSADDTIWESEYSIPLNEMKVDKAPTGEDWGLLLARDYPQLDQNAIVPTTSYRFDFVARDWRNLALANAYHFEKEYARAKFSDSEPVVQVLDLGDFLGGRIKGKFAFSNPTAQPTSVAVTFSVGSKSLQQTIQLAAGERKEWQSDEIAAIDKTAQTLKVAVNNAAGKTLYQQTIPFRPDYGRDRTTLVPDMWFSGELKNCSSVAVAMPLYNPIRNKLWAFVQLAGRPEEKDADHLEVTIRRAGEDKPFATYPMTPRPHHPGVYEMNVKLPELTPGLYEATASLYGKADQPAPTNAGDAVLAAANLKTADANPKGKLIARSRDLFNRYDHAKDLPWIDNKIGISDKVLPPWTPIVAKQTPTGIDLSCWGRTYQIDGSGFPTQIKTLDQNILTGPMHLDIVHAGKPVTLKPAPGVGSVQASATEVNYKGSLQGEGWKITTTAHFEYDGYLLYHIRLEPEGEAKSVDSIKFVIPLTSEQGKYLHAAGTNGGNMRGYVSTEALKPEVGPLWDSSMQREGRGSDGGDLAIGNFKGYVWVGGVKRGLSFLADNDKDWVPDDTKTVSSSEVVRTATGINLVLNLVGRPFTFDHPREIVFSVTATPVRPLPDDFRWARQNLSLTGAFPGKDPDDWSWDGCQMWLDGKIYLGGNGTSPFPLNWDKNKEFMGSLVKRFGPGAATQEVTKYMAMSAAFIHPEVEDPRVPGLQGNNWYGYLQPEITAHRDIFDAGISKTEMEYCLWRYQTWFKETGLHGFYFDNCYTGFSANPDAGLGYIIDLHDRPNLNGEVQPGFDWMGLREMLKRLRTLIVEDGHRPYIWLHASDTFVIPAYAFADVLLDGEDGPPISANGPWFSEKWSPGYMQTLNDGSKWGLESTMLDEMGCEGPNNVGKWRLLFRDYAGYMLLHDNEASGYRYLDWTGLDLKRKAEFLPYWDPAVAAAIHADNENILASGWTQDGELRIVVFNHSGEIKKNINLLVDPKALGLAPGKTWAVKDLQGDIKSGLPTDDPFIRWPGDVGMSFHPDGDRVTVILDILPHDYRLIRVEPAAAK